MADHFKRALLLRGGILFQERITSVNTGGGGEGGHRGNRLEFLKRSGFLSTSRVKARSGRKWDGERGEEEREKPLALVEFEFETHRESRGGFETAAWIISPGSGMEQRDVAMRYANKRFNYSTRRAEETGRFLFDSLKLPPITGRAMYPRAESPADFKKEKSTDICIITGRIRAKRMSGGNFKANSRGRIGFWMISRRDVWCSFYTKVFFFCSLKNADSGFFICTDTFIGENVEWKVGLKKRGRLGSSLYFFASKIVWNHNLTYRFTLDILRSEINIKTQ